MKRIKLLTGNLFDITAGDEERAAILKLRALLPKLTKSEVVSLAITLMHSYSLPLGRWVGVSALRGFSKDLADALLLIQVLSSPSKLAIAIELLVAQADDEGELWEPEEDLEALPE